MIEEILTVFPTLESQLLNVKRSEKSPVELLYEIAPVDEREVRLILELKVFQSVDERKPFIVEFA